MHLFHMFLMSLPAILIIALPLTLGILLWNCARERRDEEQPTQRN